MEQKLRIRTWLRILISEASLEEIELKMVEKKSKQHSQVI